MVAVLLVIFSTSAFLIMAISSVPAGSTSGPPGLLCLLVEPDHLADAVPQSDLRLPAKGRQAAGIHQLARRAVGLGGIEFERTVPAGQLGDQLMQLQDRDFL